MKIYSKCPNCGISSGTHEQITIFKCKRCGKEYCQFCSVKEKGMFGTKNKCPLCKSDGKKIGIVK